MNSVLTSLDVPDAIQDFFDIKDLKFFYDEQVELFAEGFHYVPTTINIWAAGTCRTGEVIITASAMEAVAYLNFNLHRYPDLHVVAFLALGNHPRDEQLRWIQSNFRNARVTLVFSNDLVGRAADVRVALGIRSHKIRMILTSDHVAVINRGITADFGYDGLSLNAVQKRFGIRTGIRTRKPKYFNTFLDQLIYHGK